MRGLERAEAYLDEIPMWSRKKNSLEDIRAYLDPLGDPDDSMRLIHVAGTNGKGSVCAFLTSVLMAAGYHVGTFTSPHLVCTRERFALDGEMVDEALFEASFHAVRDLTEQMMNRGYAHPTYFEFLFYMGMVIYSRKRPDFVLLETGLGGRLDTTNVIRRPCLTVITSISLDHMEYLGTTVEEIAGEKAGIIKREVPVVYDEGDSEAASVIRQRACMLRAPQYPVNQKDYEIIGCGPQGLTVRERSLDGSWLELLVPSVAEYQVANSLLALRAAEVLVRQETAAVSASQLREGISRMRWPGRMEQVMPGVYLDGAHNVGGMEAFAAAAAELVKKSGKKAYLLFAAVSDKEYEKMIKSVCERLPLAGTAVACMNTERGLDAGTLAEQFELAGCPVTVYQGVEAALDGIWKQKGREDFLFCAGSLYLIGEIKTALGRCEYDKF